MRPVGHNQVTKEKSMTTRNEANGAAVFLDYNGLSPNDREKVTIIREYLNHLNHPEHPDDAVWEEILEDLDSLDDTGDTLDHYVFSCDGKGFGVANISHSDRVVDGDTHTLSQIRDLIREKAKPPTPTIEDEQAKVAAAEAIITEQAETIRVLKEQLAEHGSARWRRGESGMIYSVRRFKGEFRICWYSYDDVTPTISGTPGIDDPYPTREAADAALEKHATEQGWEKVK